MLEGLIAVSKNLIEFSAVHSKRMSLEEENILAFFVLDKSLHYTKSGDWITFINDYNNLRIAISKTGLLNISTRVPVEKTKKNIVELADLSQKITQKLLKPEHDLYFNFLIVKKGKIDLEDLIDEDLYKEQDIKSINFILDSETNVGIIRNPLNYIISIDKIRNVKDIIKIFGYITEGKIAQLSKMGIKERKISISRSFS
ncbi:MAG: hypothetical protein SVY15_04705 [Halobacteriota archaeon]|nr:hypothetical protein [Halobacteriota archaeon]